MFYKVGDAGNIAIGDAFIKFDSKLECYEEGVVISVDDATIVVDFGDTQREWSSSEVALFGQAQGIYREFYSSPALGRVIRDYR